MTGQSTNPLYEKALAYATEKHKGQVRKYTGDPYIVHPIAVAGQMWDDTDKAIAVLHDTVEDTDATFTDILKLFGHDVMYGVWWLTDETTLEKGNRATRSLIKLNKISRAPKHIQAIKVFDTIDNLRSIFEHDKGFYQVFEKEAWNLVDAVDTYVKLALTTELLNRTKVDEK